MKINAIDPKRGLPAGGELVCIEVEGDDLDEDTLDIVTVYFGKGQATDIGCDTWDDKNKTGTITATSPPGHGTVDVTVITPGLTEKAIKKRAFTYRIVGPLKPAAKGRAPASDTEQAPPGGDEESTQ